jgi:hypothetical protein
MVVVVGVPLAMVLVALVVLVGETPVNMFLLGELH